MMYLFFSYRGRDKRKGYTFRFLRVWFFPPEEEEKTQFPGEPPFVKKGRKGEAGGPVNLLECIFTQKGMGGLTT